MVNKKFKMAVKTSPHKAYELTHKAELHPSTLSKIIHGIELVKDGDPRVLAVARVLGLPPEECFRENIQ